MVLKHLWPKLLILGMVIAPFIGNSLLWAYKPLLLLGWNQYNYTKDFGETADPPQNKKLSWKVGHKPIVINGVSSPPINDLWVTGFMGTLFKPIYTWSYRTFQPNLKLVGPHLVGSFSEYDFPWGFSAASRLYWWCSNNPRKSVVSEPPALHRTNEKGQNLNRRSIFLDTSREYTHIEKNCQISDTSHCPPYLSLLKLAIFVVCQFCRLDPRPCNFKTIYYKHILNLNISLN